MKKIVIAPDSFKGTLSSLEVCNLVKQSLLEERDDLEIVEVPIADGGEGMTESFMCAIDGSEKIELKAKSPLGRDIDVYYAVVYGDTAVIEMAMASGITIEKEKDAMKASTYGTGQIIKHALDKGIRKFFLGIGGSATTDGGIGCVAALGGKFLSKDGKEVPLCGEGLSLIEKIDLSGLDERIKVIVASDFGIGWDQTNWTDIWYWGDQVNTLKEKNMDHAELLSLFAPKPFCLIAGEFDNMDSWDMMCRAPGYTPGDGRLKIINHATGHTPPPDALREGYEFLDHWLK